MKNKTGGWGGPFCWLLAALLPACGFKTLPLPPRDNFPAPVSDLRFELEARQVTLAWTIPQRTRKGEPLEPIASYRIFRGLTSNEEYCPSCPPLFSEEFEIPASRVAAGAGQARYAEPLTREGRYFYKIQANSGWRLPGDDSNPVSFVWLAPVKEPRELTARGEEAGVALAWQPPDGYTDSTPLAGPLLYRVYRSRAGGDFLPLGDAPQAATAYRDQGLNNGQSYSYRVRAFRANSDSSWIPGLASTVVAATPVDLTPPPPPSELSLTGLEQAVRISWGLGLEEELGGYRLYRRRASESTPRLLATVGGREFTFIDREVPEGAWYYSLTALDQAEPPNESAPSTEIFYQMGE